MGDVSSEKIEELLQEARSERLADPNEPDDESVSEFNDMIAEKTFLRRFLFSMTIFMIVACTLFICWAIFDEPIFIIIGFLAFVIPFLFLRLFFRHYLFPGLGHFGTWRSKKDSISSNSSADSMRPLSTRETRFVMMSLVASLSLICASIIWIFLDLSSSFTRTILQHQYARVGTALLCAFAIILLYRLLVMIKPSVRIRIIGREKRVRAPMEGVRLSDEAASLEKYPDQVQPAPKEFKFK